MKDENLLLFFDEVKDDLLKIFDNVSYGLYFGGRIVYTYDMKDGTKRTFDVDLDVIDNNLSNELLTRDQVKKYIIELAMMAVYKREGEETNG